MFSKFKAELLNTTKLLKFSKFSTVAPKFSKNRFEKEVSSSTLVN